MRFLVKETAARHDHLTCDTHDPYFLQRAALNIVTGDVYCGPDLYVILYTHTHTHICTYRCMRHVRRKTCPRYEIYVIRYYGILIRRDNARSFSLELFIL